jgi:hypothetical protein
VISIAKARVRSFVPLKKQHTQASFILSSVLYIQALMDPFKGVGGDQLTNNESVRAVFWKQDYIKRLTKRNTLDFLS